MKYDSVVLGNGFTIGVLNQLYKYTTSPILKYVNVNEFIFDIAKDEDHKRINKDFYRYFNINKQSKRVHEESKAYILSNMDEIKNIGFERWFGKYIFDKNEKMSNIKYYLYILYNFWWHVLDENILNINKIIKFRENCCDKIKMIVKNEEKIFTTNFDNLIDPFLSAKHMHGKFILPLTNLKNMEYIRIDEKNFEYPYLFGTNGYEKLNRLNIIREHEKPIYDLSFFYDLEIDLKSILVFGLSFGESKVIPDKLKAKYENLSLVDSVDGHIILKLQERLEKGKLEKITITYYTEEDLKYYNEIMSKSNLIDVVEFIHSSCILNFENAL